MEGPQIGEIFNLDPKQVEADAIERLKERMIAPKEVYTFDCVLCGAERTARVFDPGYLIAHELDCSDSVEDVPCKKPATPPVYLRRRHLVPGSLVYAPLARELGTPCKDSYWPAIIEDYPFGDQGYMLPAVDEGAERHREAYFVTFIMPPGKDFCGGWIERNELYPFGPRRLPENRTDIYDKSMSLARAGSYAPLAQRLEELSFVGHVAKSRAASSGFDPDVSEQLARLMRTED